MNLHLSPLAVSRPSGLKVLTGKSCIHQHTHMDTGSNKKGLMGGGLSG